MRRKYQIVDVALLLALLFSAGTHFSYAYLDFASGSYVLQMALAGVFGALFVVKTFWTQIRTFFSEKLLRRSATKQSL